MTSEGSLILIRELDERLGLEKKTCLRNGFERPDFGPWDFQETAEKAIQSTT